MSQLIEIQPSRELQFIFEAMRQSTCNVRLINKTDQRVAFKIKTTSPKKYCVRPNVGMILPKGTCEFIVIMQAPRSAPPDMICKDKFLIQSTIVPAGMTEEDVTSDMFSKDGKYIEERKLRVVLVSPPHSPDFAKSPPHSPDFAPINGKLKPPPPFKSSVVDSELFDGTGSHALHHLDKDHVEELKISNEERKTPSPGAVSPAVKNIEPKLKEAKPVISWDVGPKPIDVVEPNPVAKLQAQLLKEAEPKLVNDAEDLRFAKELEEMKSKLIELESKLGQADSTIAKFMEERKSTTQEREYLQQELARLGKGKVQKTVYVGFPLLYVCMVAIISTLIGYILHPNEHHISPSTDYRRGIFMFS